jgi:hypothetical protein
MPWIGTHSYGEASMSLLVARRQRTRSTDSGWVGVPHRVRLPLELLPHHKVVVHPCCSGNRKQSTQA